MTPATSVPWPFRSLAVKLRLEKSLTRVTRPPKSGWVERTPVSSTATRRGVDVPGTMSHADGAPTCCERPLRDPEAVGVAGIVRRVGDAVDHVGFDGGDNRVSRASVIRSRPLTRTATRRSSTTRTSSPPIASMVRACSAAVVPISNVTITRSAGAGTVTPKAGAVGVRSAANSDDAQSRSTFGGRAGESSQLDVGIERVTMQQVGHPSSGRGRAPSRRAGTARGSAGPRWGPTRSFRARSHSRPCR